MNKRRGPFWTPKLVLLAVLLCIAGISMLNVKQAQAEALTMAAGVGTGLIFDFIVGLFQRRKKLFPDGAIVTGLIVALVLGAQTPWYICAVVTLVALLSKHFLKSKRKPLFNPAAFGLLFAIVVFSSMESWWGGLSLLPSWCVFMLLVAGYFITNRVNKFPQVLAYLGTYFLIQLVLGYNHVGDAADAVRTPFVNSVLFLAFFMLTDPPTSPGKYRDQVIFGMIAAAVGAGVYALFGGLAYLLIGLLVANVWSFAFANKPAVNRAVRAVRPTGPVSR